MPVIPVPLINPDPDVPLDLQAVVAAVYERGGDADLIDYRKEMPPPLLSESENAWITELLAAHRAG